jgi:rod shape-determining protein MreD
MARRSQSFWVFVAVLILAHFTLRVAFGIGGAVPDLLTASVLLAARRLRTPIAALFGFVFGLIEDGLALTAFGATAVALTAVGFLGAR